MQKKKRKYEKFTKEEDNILINEIKNCPTNIKNAMVIASKKMNRNVDSLRQRWYAYLSKQENVSVITCGSKRGFTQNVKNIKRNEDGTMPEQGLKNHLYLLKEILSLPPKEREMIISVLKSN